MNHPTAETLLVIPCYRDGIALAKFLGELCPALAACPGRVRICVVDDGSPAAAQQALAAAIEKIRPQYPDLSPLLAYPVNQGKGHAINTGWATATDERWLGFVDADGAVPANEVAALITQAQQTSARVMFVAVRDTHSGKSVQRLWHRRLGSRLFNAWMRWHLNLRLDDTQCGLKIIPASLHAQGPWLEREFALDLEILLRAQAQKLPVHTHAIAWHEKPGTALGWRNMLRLFSDVRRLRATIRHRL